MADPQELPDERPESAAQAPEVPAAPAPTPPADPAPLGDSAKPPAKKAAAKKAPAKKAPAKKAPAKKAPAKKAVPPVTPSALVATNGSAQPEGAKEAAAQAKSAIDQAGDAVRRTPPVPVAHDDSGRSPVPFVAALLVSLLAVLLVRRLRQADEDS